MATHSSALAWRILLTEEPGGLLSSGSHRVGHYWSNLACMHALEKEMAAHSSVLAWRIPGIGEPGGLPPMGSHRVGHDWRDLAAAAAVQYLPSCLLGTCISLWTIRHMSVSEPLNNLELFPLDMHKSHFLSSSWGLDPNILSMKLCRTILNSNSWFVILLPGSIFFFFLSRVLVTIWYITYSIYLCFIYFSFIGMYISLVQGFLNVC